MRNSDLIKKIYARTAQNARSPTNKAPRYSVRHVGMTLDAFVDEMSQSLNEKGEFVFNGFGRFSRQKSDGVIRFTPQKKFDRKISGDDNLFSEDNEK